MERSASSLPLATLPAQPRSLSWSTSPPRQAACNSSVYTHVWLSAVVLRSMRCLPTRLTAPPLSCGSDDAGYRGCSALRLHRRRTPAGDQFYLLQELSGSHLLRGRPRPSVVAGSADVAVPRSCSARSSRGIPPMAIRGWPRRAAV